MGKLSDDGKWLQENLNELLQDSPETDKQREQKRLAELLSKFSELQPNLNKVTDKSAVFSKAYDYRDTMEKHNGWLDETQRLVNDDPSIDGLEDARAYLQEHEVRHPSFSEILFNLYKMGKAPHCKSQGNMQVRFILKIKYLNSLIYVRALTQLRQMYDCAFMIVSLGGEGSYYTLHCQLSICLFICFSMTHIKVILEGQTTHTFYS